MSEKSTRYQYDARAAARTSVARELLKPEHSARRREHGLLDDDLEVIARHGDSAATHDANQRAQLAAQRSEQQEILQNRQAVEAEQEQLRNRLAAVALDLAGAPATTPLAQWLAAASFERFRVRVTLPTSAEPANTPAEPTRERVVRHDLLSRAQSLYQFTTMLLETSRAPIVERLAARGMGRDRLTRLVTAAETLVGRLGDKAVLKATEATALEAEAVQNQKTRWDACRRMIRAAVTGHADLERLWAAC